MKHRIFSVGRSLAICLAAAFTAATASAQTTATWIGPASGGEWNTDANWDSGAPPLDSTTNAFIGVGTNASYNLPMVATSFGTLTLNGILNVNTNGFNSSAITLVRPGGGNRLFVNNGGVVNVSGSLIISSNAFVIVTNGGSLTAGTLQVGSGSTAGSGGIMTNSGGTVSATTTILNNNNASATGLFVINGGTNSLGNVTINRSSPSSQPALGTEGLVIYNGLVNMTSLSVGGASANSFLTMLVAGGIVTNTGNATVHLTGTASRPGRLLQTGGLFVTTDPNVVTMNPQGAAGVVTVYSVTGGTNIVGGFQFGDLAGANIGIANFTNAASIYVGSSGMASNGAVTLNASLNNGGIFGAHADWTGSVPMNLSSGTFNFKAADLDGTAHNITLSGALRGSGSLKKIGGGLLTLTASNSYTGSTIIDAGTLALAPDVSGSTGSISSIFPIIVGSGATFDVSQLSGFVLNASQILSGSGVVTGAVSIASGGIINPGSNTLTGTLTFSNTVTETGGAINRFDLSSNPNGSSNDFVHIAGDFTVSGSNTVNIVGAVPSETNYTLIKYDGNFNGDITNFTLTGAIGILTNDAVAKTISIKTLTSTRGTATITWTGNALTNNWDLTITTNWLNAGVLDYFIANDNVIFNATGAANPTVNIVGSLLPSSVVVDAATDYAFTNTSGSIDGTGGLTKNNSGTLSIQTTNNYTGITTIGNGVIEVSQLANSTLGSAIGAASSDSANLVISNATLRYIGDSVSTDHGATFTGTNGVIDVTNSATTLTVSGTLLGSGTLTKVGQGTLIVSGINSYGSTIVSNGILQINTTISAVGSGAIKFGGGTVRMNVSSQQTYPNALNVASASTLIAAGGNNNIVGGHWSGSGTLNLDMTSGGTFTINADMTTNFDGTILLADTSAGTFRFNSGGSSSGVQQSVGSPTATFDLGNSTVILANRNGGGDSFGNYQLGALAGGVSTFLRGSGNSGSSASTYHIGAKNLNTTFAGTIATGSGGGGAAVNIVKIGTGTFTLTGNSTYNGYTTISNGVLALSGSGAIGSTTNINIIAGTALDVSARDDGTLTLNNNQILRGNGTVFGSVTASSGSTVSPGTSIGLLTITNALNLQGGSTTLMELDATAGTNDVIAVQGGVAYGGTLQINLVNGTLAAGQIYKLFNAPSGQYSGSFDGGVSPASTNGLTWDTSKLTVDGTLKVIVATKPVIGNISISGSDLSFSGNNGIPNASFNLLSSTDVTLPLSSWTVVGAYTFDGSGNFSFTLSGAFDPNQPQVFYSVQY